MKSNGIKAVLAILVVCVLSLSLIPVADAAGRLGNKLTSEEIAFAMAVGNGEYAYEQDWIYSYEYGEFEIDLGEAWRGAGSEPAHEYAMYLKDEMTDIGLQDVTLEGFPVHAYNYGGASVQVLDPVESEEWLAAGHGGLPGTPSDGITAEIVYVGLGTMYDYEGKDVTGKLVLIDVSEEEMYWLQYPLYEAELHGAVGAVVHWVEYQLLEDAVVTHDSEARTTIPAVCISHNNAEYLIDLIMTSDDPVTVKIWCDADIDYDGVGNNVYGYIWGTTHPDEYILIADHYDKWWYGADDNGAGVARLLGIAKAMVNSGYMPSRTIVFLATDAEEYGWTDTEFDWALGAWWAIFDQHPDWAGKTLGAFCLEGGGTTGATSVYAHGTPETQMFRKGLLQLFNEWFSNTAPWSSYYVNSVEWTDSFATTWADEFSFCSAGIPIMNVGSWRSAYEGYDYHTQYDAMYGISAESLAMSIVSNGIAAIEMDRSVIIPYSFQKRADDLGKQLEDWLIKAAGLDSTEIMQALKEFYRVSDDVWKLIKSKQYSGDPDMINAKLLEIAKLVLSDFTQVGGYVEAFYPHRHYQDDTWFLREGIESLEDGNINRALMWLSWVYGMYHGRWCSYENYEYMQLDRWNDDNFNQFWARGRTANVIDIWDEYITLWEKRMTGDKDFSDEIESLWMKYNVQVEYFDAALEDMTMTLYSATEKLNDVKMMLM
ncbi:MAG: M28 family peptidase [Thermoplasmata archaeon]|nr:M28 family peptidase [Thermoplasmata archaeon]